MEYRKNKLRGYLCLKYFSIKYIDTKVQNKLEEIIINYWQGKGYELSLILVKEDCVQLVVDYPLDLAASSLVVGFKTRTSRMIREAFPTTLGKQKSFWIDRRNQGELRRNYIFISLNPYENPPVMGD